jgi:hypothetical protein
MGADDDIAASLPRPPLPAPARREAAITAAMRRFDGVGDPQAAAARRPAAAWRRRPFMGALAGTALVALIAVPLAWTSFDQQPYREARKPPPNASRPDPSAADPAASPPVPAPPGAKGDEAPLATPISAPDEAPAPAPVDAAKAAAEPAPVAAPPPPAEPLASRAEAQPDATGGEQVVVTGSRIRRPNLESAAPVTVVDSGIVATGARSASGRAARRGDWNSCTVEDPGRSLGACPASTEVADGLAQAWKGDWDGALAAFDAAIAAAPRSSAAWLNRGLVHRRRGELDRALADLDRAVRFSPRTARYHYQRSLLLRQRGDVRRAQADEARAVELDPRYAEVVRKY